MPYTLVIGAGGNIGQQIVGRLIAMGIPTAALLRDKQKCYFPEPCKVIEGDIENDISHALSECDRVIFTAGSGASTGFDKTLLVDLWGASKAVDAARNAGIKHFIMISSRGAQNPDNGPDRIKPYLVAKHFADEHLRRSGLTYTILQPGRLIDDKATGLITTNRPSAAEQQIISREETANIVVYCLNNSITHGKTYELFIGDTPINSAIN